MSLCESICSFKGYINKYIECECDIKLKFNSFLNERSDKYHLIYRFDKDDSNPINLWTLKCFLNPNIKGTLIFNLCSIFVLIILFSIIIGSFIFYIYEQNLLFQKIRILIKIKFNTKKDSDVEKINIEEKKEKKENKIKKNKIKAKKNKESKNADLIGILDNILKINKIKANRIINKNNLNNITSNSNNNSKISFFPNENKNKISKKEMIENIKNSYLEKSDYEISLLSYKEALNKLNFSEIFFSLLNSYLILLFVFKKQRKNDYDSKIIKICYFLFLVILYFTFNTLFVDMPSFHNIYLSKGKLAIGSNINKIIFATLISYIIQKLSTLVFFTHSTVIKIKNCEIENKEKTIKDVYYMVTIKCIIFFCSIIFMSILFWFYVGCFCILFPKTQIYLLVITIISMIISFGFSFIILAVIVFIRVYSLNKSNRENLYRLSQFLQII